MDDFEHDQSAGGQRMAPGSRAGAGPSGIGSSGAGPSGADQPTLHLDGERRPDEAARSEEDAEARMRQALSQFGQRSFRSDSGPPVERRGNGGGYPSSNARRHRFVQDGEVQVSVVRPRRDAPPPSLARAPEGREQRAVDEHAAERTLREQAERKLAEALMTIKTLQTRIGHAELERDEAVEEARGLREQLLMERSSADEARAGRAVTAMRRSRPEPDRVEEAGQGPDRPQLGPSPGPGAAEDVEQEPVKWWL